MSEVLRPTGREICSDHAVAEHLNGTQLRNRQLIRLVATKKQFKECDFSYSEFDSAYLRNCAFDSCNFTGCKFTNSNLRGSEFIGCKFDYALFSNTHVEPEILDMGCPGQENLQQKFARSLRLNFQQIGDSSAANKAIKIELDATRVHLYKAWRSRESYYRKKYPGSSRVRMFWEWLRFVLLDAYWGNGESPLKLLGSAILVVVLIALIGTLSLPDSARFLPSYASALLQAPSVLLGVARPPEYPDAALAAFAVLRYVLMACFVSILIKRLSRR